MRNGGGSGGGGGAGAGAADGNKDGTTPPGLWKLLLGNVRAAAWQSESFPNATTGFFPTQDCGGGCLFKLQSDPSEYHDVAAAQPGLVTKLKAAIAAAQATAFSPDRGGFCPRNMR
jgi:hypothetical protein